MDDVWVNASVALGVALVGFLGVEGGSRRRSVKLITDEIELLKRLDPNTERARQLRIVIDKRLDQHCETLGARIARYVGGATFWLSLWAWATVVIVDLVSAMEERRGPHWLTWLSLAGAVLVAGIWWRMQGWTAYQVARGARLAREERDRQALIREEAQHASPIRPSQLRRSSRDLRR